MATLQSSILTLLNSTPAISAIVTGGFFNSEDLPPDDGGWDFAPKAVDDPDTIQVFGVVRWASAVRVGPIGLSARSRDCEIYVYAPIGYDTIDSVINLIDTLLDQQMFVTDDYDMAHFDMTLQSKGVMAQEYRNSPCRFVRFACTQIKH